MFVCCILICRFMQNTTIQWRRATQFWEKYTPTLMAISIVSFSFSRAAQPEAQGPTLLDAGFLYRILSPTGLVSKLTDFLSSPSYIIVPSPTQSLEWHVWSSSSRNNCHAVHRSLSFGASVYDCTAGFYLVPYCQPSPPMQMEYATSTSLEWHVWLGQRSIYNISSCPQLFLIVRVLCQLIPLYDISG